MYLGSEVRSKINDCHLEEYGVVPETVVSAPGVIRFFGEFADVYLGRAISASDNDDIYISISRRTDGQVRVFGSKTKERKHFAMANMKNKPGENMLNCIKSVCCFFREKNIGLQGLDIVLYGNSDVMYHRLRCTSVIVGLVYSINTLFGLNMDKRTMAEASYMAPKNFCDFSCSYIDIVTVLNAQKGKYMSFDLKEGSFEYIPSNGLSQNYSCLTVKPNTGTYEIGEEILRAYASFSKVFPMFRAKTPYPGFWSVTDTEIDSLRGLFNKEAFESLKYMYHEFRTALSAVKAFKAGDCITIGSLYNKMNKLICNSTDMFSPELDWLLKRASELTECVGAGIVSNGIETLGVVEIKTDAVDKYVAKVAEYEHIFGFKSEIAEFAPSDGIKFVTD